MSISQTYGDHLAIYRYSSPPLFTVSLPIDSVTCGQLQSKTTTVCPLVSMGSCFQDPLQIPKSLDAQVPQSTLWILGSASAAPVDSITTDHVVLHLFQKSCISQQFKNVYSRVNSKGKFLSQCLHHSSHFISLGQYCIISYVQLSTGE